VINKLKIFVIILLILFSVNLAYAATVVFKTGFEGNVALDVKAGGASQQYWSDAVNPSYAINKYGNGGEVDSATGYNVPFDMPGYCQNHDCYTQSGGGAPYFNFVKSGTDDVAEITSSIKKNGSYALRIYNADIGDPASRAQLNIESGSSGVNNFSNYSLVKYWVYWTKLPSLVTSQWFMFYEWYGSHYPGRLMWVSNSSSGTLKLQAFGDSTSYGSASWRAQSDPVDPNDYLNKWVEVIVYMRWGTGGTGRCIIKMKPDGGSGQTLINYTGTNTQGGSSISTMAPIKSYGPGSKNSWTYYDDFTMYSSTGPTDLPDWDSQGVEADQSITPPSGLRLITNP
jgi:hypothetical protein